MRLVRGRVTAWWSKIRAPVRYAVADPAGGAVLLRVPDYVEPSADDALLVSRIYEAFSRMKQAQGSAPAVFLPSSLWQEQLDESYTPMRTREAGGSLDEFHFYLANFGAWKRFTGITWSTLHHEARTLTQRRKLIETYVNLLRTWTWMHGGRKSPAALDHPLHGNQVGAQLASGFVTISSFPMEYYASLLAPLAAASGPRPAIAELGAGYGNLAYYLLSQLPAATFVDFDLPETLSVAAYFLMKTFPDKRALLYGEGQYDPSSRSDFDLVFLPSWEISRLSPRSVDLFSNYASLGEMTAEAARTYVSAITRATKYFFHVNHEVFRNVYGEGDASLLAHEYPVPAEEFDLLSRSPELFISTLNGTLDYASQSFVYLYGRRVRS
jgi:hypothetical protein